MADLKRVECVTCEHQKGRCTHPGIPEPRYLVFSIRTGYGQHRRPDWCPIEPTSTWVPKTDEAFTSREQNLMEAAIGGGISAAIQHVCDTLKVDFELNGEDHVLLTSKVMADMKSAMQVKKKVDDA